MFAITKEEKGQSVFQLVGYCDTAQLHSCTVQLGHSHTKFPRECIFVKIVCDRKTRGKFLSCLTFRVTGKSFSNEYLVTYTRVRVSCVFVCFCFCVSCISFVETKNELFLQTQIAFVSNMGLLPAALLFQKFNLFPFFGSLRIK